MNHPTPGTPRHDFLSGIVNIFLRSNLSIMLIIFSLLAGAAALFITPREEDPQIVVPLADIYVNFPGWTANEVERYVSARLERLLFEIDGVEYVYSMSPRTRRSSRFASLWARTVNAASSSCSRNSAKISS